MTRAVDNTRGPERVPTMWTQWDAAVVPPELRQAIAADPSHQHIQLVRVPRGDEQVPAILVGSQILVIATPTWVGRPASVCQRVLERMDAMLSETDDEGRPIAYNRVAGVVVTGNEDGAHHVISEVSGALIDIGYTIPGQAWTYWNKGPGPGDEYLDADDDEGKEWSRSTGEAAAQNLVAVAEALAQRPMEKPPGD